MWSILSVDARLCGGSSCNFLVAKFNEDSVSCVGETLVEVESGSVAGSIESIGFDSSISGVIESHSSS